MSIDLKEFLFLNSKDIFDNTRSGWTKDKGLKWNIEEVLEKIKSDTDMNVFLEIILDDFLRRLLNIKNESKNEIIYEEVIFAFKCLKKETFKIIENKEIDLQEKMKLIMDFNELADNLELLMIKKFDNGKTAYLNFETITKIGDASVILSVNDEIIYANEVANKMFEYTTSQLKSEKREDFFKIINNIDIPKNDFVEEIFEGQVKRDDEIEKWIEFRIGKIELEKRNIEVAIGQDVSARKVMEEKLKESEERYKLLFEVMPDPLYAYGEDGIVFANNAALKMFGYNKFEEIQNKNLNELWSILPEYQSKYQQQMDKLKRIGKISGLEKKCIRKIDNKLLELETTAVSYFIGGGKFVINISRDIAERNKVRLLKEGVREKTLKLVEAKKYDELKNEFLANISHEFRTPINIIMTAMKLVETLFNEDKLNKDDLKRYTYLSKQNCFRLIKLVDNILDMTKIDAGHMLLDLKKRNIVEFIEDVTISVREYIASKNLKLIFDTNVEERMMLFDMSIVERIILNLLSNAAKYTNAGGEINVNIIDTNNKIIIEVEDNGIGIPKDKQKVIFDRFVQVDKTLSRNKEGSGIGLSLVRELVELHKGNIKVISEEGIGTKFIIELPIDDKELNDLFDNSLHVNRASRSLIESIDIQFSDIYAQW
ncbi:sensor histidine kinase [Oceanirhabdus seepicola]|uniref:histidine kinase n=1 Tax=Oceanirhabdus seepicola TaxID=2828781 RepID=A0A9J6NZB8_9CLOT|nr:PAS domain-containing sensor histidine kinase [Oceanirhabdus seepicola]MCM1989879.1 PAS domain-containing sensor histidine kinase [Oceanirhabdus seepicola]